MDKMTVARSCAAMVFMIFFSGCSTVSAPPAALHEQMDAAQKVVGAMAPAAGVAAEKYSPVTGKHYSGALEYEPGTGAKLIPVEE
jgi:hypothetical protein